MAKKNIFGLIYDDKTLKVTYDDGEVPVVGGDFTFENHEGYNPLQYATDKTGEKVISILKANLPEDVGLKLSRTVVTGPIAPPPQLVVEVSRNGISETFNVGLIANSLIRSGSLASFKQDLKVAGILF